MKVSVIVPTYNEERVITDCLNSLFQQSYKDLEIIVVNDGSTDNTLSEIRNSKRLQRPAGEIRVLRAAHWGAGAARNFGARHARGEILVFVDADMTFDKDFIKKLIDPILKGKVIGTFSKEEYLGNKDNVWAINWNLNRGLPSGRMHSKDYPDHQPVFRAILKSEFDKAGGFNQNAGYIDDWSLSQKLGVEAVAAHGAIFYHKNPDNLRDVFIQAKWMAKRNYKFGILGGLVRAWFPIKLSPIFLIFKMVFILATTVGVLEYFIFGKVTK